LKTDLHIYQIPLGCFHSYTETSLRCSLPVPARLYGQANVAFKTPHSGTIIFHHIMPHFTMEGVHRGWIGNF